MTANGFNRLRWDCKAGGCFNVKRRPKIEVFAECFPRAINFGDVDGLVEFNRFLILLEWKGDGGSLREAQRRAYNVLTKQKFGNAVIVIHGNAETMQTDGYHWFWDGKHTPFTSANLDQIREQIRSWASWTKGIG